MNNMYSALIVDDEDLARSDLKALLSKIPQVEIVAEADSIKSAKEKIDKFCPNLIFLDIQLQGENGFDLFYDLDNNIKIVFVTAYDQYAIRAFDVNALDYLIKPVDPERLTLTIKRLEEKLNSLENELKSFNYSDTIFIDDGLNFHFVKLSDIVLISAEGVYSKVSTFKGLKVLCNKPMKEWESRLPENIFIRIHRSTIINIEYIEKIDRWFNYSYRVFVKNIAEPFPISRRYISLIRKKMT